MQKRAVIQKLTLFTGLLVAGAALAADRTWIGGAGTTVINTAGNWSGGAAPTTAGGDRAIWDGTVQTNVPYVWSTGFGSGNAGGMGIEIGPGYTSAFTLYGTAGQNAGLSNIVVQAGAGPVTLGDETGAAVSTTVWRSAGTNGFLNYSANPGTISQNVFFNNGSGASRSVYFIGSWNIFSPVQPDGAGGMALVIDGTGANTVTLNASITKNSQSWTINSGTLMPTVSEALANGGSQTVTIAGGAGVKRLALTNYVSLNPAVVNINIAGRNSTSGAAEAAIYNVANDNSINGVIRFNAAGGTNVVIYNAAASLTVNSNLTAANVTGDRYFWFDGPGTTYVNGTVANGSANLGLALNAGTVSLNNSNTFTGRTILNGGVLTVGNDYALANSTVEINGGKLDVNGGGGFSPRIGGLSGAGLVDSVSGGSPTLYVGNNNVSSSFAGSIGNSLGTVALEKIGSGTLTLSGASSYSGGTTVAAGTLLVNNTTGSGTGSGGITVNANATLGGIGIIQGTVNWQSGSKALFTVTPNAAVPGSNSTPLTISGALTLNGNAVTVNVPGATPLSPGTYRLMNYSGGASGAFASAVTYSGAGADLGTASSVSMSGGALNLVVTFTGIVSTWTNITDGNWTTGTAWSSNPYYPHVAGDAATLGVGAAYTTVALDGNISIGTLNFTNQNSFHVANAGNTLTFANNATDAFVNVAAGASNVISAPITLSTNLSIATASGTSLALTNAISKSGGNPTLAISGPGSVVLSGNNTYGPAAGSVGTILNSNPILELGQNSALSAGDVSLLSSATLRASAPLSLANNIIDNAGTTTVDNNGNNVTLNGIISGGGALAKNGTGTLALNGANSYAGDTTINAGSVILGNDSGIPGGTGRGNLTMGDNTTLNLNGHSVVLNGLNSTTNTAAIDTLTGGAITLTLGQSDAGGTFLGSIKNTSGSLLLVKNGAGTQTLGGTNSYTGGTTINAGTLQIGNGGTAGNLGSGPLVDNGNLQFNLSGANAFGGGISGTGTVTLANASLNLWLTGNNTFTGNVIINSGNLWVTNSASLGVGPKTVVVTGGGVSALTTLHLAGNVTIDPSIAYQVSYVNGAVVNESGTNTLEGEIGLPFGGGAAYINSSNGLLRLAGSIYAINGGRTLQLGGAADGIVSGSVVNTGPGGDLGAVQKIGTGTWTFTGENTYGAATAVNAGTLLVNGNNYGAGAITVATNATFGGFGAVYSAVTWQAVSKGRFVTSVSSSTPLTVYGNVTLNNNAIEIYVDGGAPLTPGTYTLLVEGNTGLYSIIGSFASTPIITGAGIQAGTIATVSSSSTQVILTVATSSTWVHNGNGNWTTGANWSSNPQFPAAAGEFALLGVGSSFTTINLDTSETIGGVSFTNANSFAIASGVNTLTLNNNGFGSSISVMAGESNSISAKVTLSDNTSVSTVSSTALSIPSVIDGSGGLTLTGNGLVNLGGANTFSGNTALSGGQLVLGNASALGFGTITFNGGAFDSSVPNLVNVNNNPQNWSGSFAFLGSQNFNLGSGSVNLAGNTTLNVNSNTLVVGGSVGGSFALNKVGPGTLVLSQANSFSGGTVISNGTVAIGDDAAFGTGTLHLGFTSGAGAGATIRSVDSTPHTIANNVSANVSTPNVFAGTGDLTFNGTIATGNGAKTFVVSNSVVTFNGSLTDGGAPFGPIVKDGPGRLILNAVSAVTKQLQVNGGTLVLGNANALGSGTLVMTGGGLDSTADLVNAGNNSQNWNGDFGFTGSYNLDMGNGVVTLNTNAVLTINANTLTIGGGVNGPTNSLTKAGAGRLVLNGVNNFGNTVVTAGTLQIAQATLRTNSTVSVASGAALQLDFSTTNQIAGLSLNGVAQPTGVYKSSTPGGYITGSGALLVIPLGPTGPARLTNSIAGNQLSLAWPAGQGWKLQMQTNSLSTGLGTNWIYITDGSVNSTNITIDPSKPTVFYRLVYP